MQERCGRTARELFKLIFGDGIEKSSDSETISDYENHYKATLNRCYAMFRSNTKGSKHPDGGRWWTRRWLR
jgi:hypothetical protein